MCQGRDFFIILRIYCKTYTLCFRIVSTILFVLLISFTKLGNLIKLYSIIGRRSWVQTPPRGTKIYFSHVTLLV